MIDHLLRFSLFLTITILWYTGLFWLGLPFVLWATYRYMPFELVLIGILIDLQFMGDAHVPVYTLFAIVWSALAYWLKPALSVSRHSV